jgi:hypothetical protein
MGLGQGTVALLLTEGLQSIMFNHTTVLFGLTLLL